MTKPPLRMVAPFGFYGWGNTGDEATLQGFAKLLEATLPSARVRVASQNPRHTGRVEPRLRYFKAGDKWPLRLAWYRSNCVVFPGGTPIMDGLGNWPLGVVAPLVREAAAHGRPVAFVGTGTERLQRSQSEKIVSEDIAPHVAQWTVRTAHDRDRLTSWGVHLDRVLVAADMAWLISPVTQAFGRRELRLLRIPEASPVVAVNVNNERVMLEKQPDFFHNIAACLDRVIHDQDAWVVFFCAESRGGEEFDHAAALKVWALMRRPDRAVMFPNRYYAPQELMSLIACCQWIMSTRYHVCLFGALQSVPFVALERSDKVSDLCTDIGWPLGLRLGTTSLDALEAHTRQAATDHRDLSARLVVATAARARESLKNRVALEALVGQLA